MFRKRRRRDPAFAADWAAALVEADARLGKAESAFVGTVARNRPLGMGTVTSDCPRLPRPGPKRKPQERGHVIRRTRGGRAQIALAHEGHMTAESEADFLARLRATGNFHRSALATGFQPASLHQRMRQWPAFARDCEQALDEASVQLDYELVAHAHSLLRRPGDAREEGGEEDDGVPFDPEAAMRILGFIDRRRSGRTTRGPRKGPPERSFAQAVESVLAKIAAIERHEKLIEERGKGDSPK
jgi:hypothetical protein